MQKLYGQLLISLLTDESGAIVPYQQAAAPLDGKIPMPSIAVEVSEEQFKTLLATAQAHTQASFKGKAYDAYVVSLPASFNLSIRQPETAPKPVSRARRRPAVPEGGFRRRRR